MSSFVYHPLPENFFSLLEQRTNVVLLETLRCDAENSSSYIFLEPVNILVAHTLDDIPLLFKSIDNALSSGFYVAGWMAYECGYHFEPASFRSAYNLGSPLAWFGVYKAPIIFNHITNVIENQPDQLSPAKKSRRAGKFHSRIPVFGISYNDYQKKILTIGRYLRSGDTYQVNYTNAYQFEIAGDPVSLFCDLKQRQPTSYCAFIRYNDGHILSFSPELFFRKTGNIITVRPMKGTAPRGKFLADDENQLAWLRGDEKNRSENLMIVDLLRNDVGRVAEPGSVSVKEMFGIETYQTLFQMTSTITARLRDGTSNYDLFKSLFPSGSVTGAPKIRTMQIIRELEQRPRGIYTGAIGFFAPNKNAVFNVAIRTIDIRNGKGVMGVGSGIVIDSDPSTEYRECLLKARFLTQPPEDFQLIETMLWSDGYPLLRYHLDRCSSSAKYFGFRFNNDAVLETLHRNEFSLKKKLKYKVRLLVSRNGEHSVQNTELTETFSAGKILLAEERIDSTNKFYFHKTTLRILYDRMTAQAKSKRCDDFIFRNERGEITEGCISNIFIRRGKSLFTPPLDCGLLPGVYRQYILEKNPSASERKMYVHDLEKADAIFICNAVRGIRKVDLSTEEK